MDLPTYGLLLLLMQLEETIALNFRIFTDAQLEMIPNILIDLHEKMFVLTFKSTRPRGSTEPAMRIEAAAYRGKPVYFELIGPWTRPERMRPYEPSVGEKAVLCSPSFCCFRCWWPARCLPGGTCALAGATAVGLSVWQVLFLRLGRLLGSLAHITSRTSPNSRSSSSSWPGPSLVLFLLGPLHCLGTLCAPPLARHAGLLEPLAGGRLSGSAGGTRCACRLSFGGVCDRSRKTGMVCSLLAWLSSAATLFGSAVAVSGRAHDHCFDIEQFDLSDFFSRLRFCLSWSFCGPCCATSGRLRSHVFFCSRVFYAAGNHALLVPAVFVTWLITIALTVFLLIRFGLLAVVAAGVFNDLLGSFPLTTQGSAWYAGISLAGILLMAAIALYAFYTSLGNRPVFGGAMLEE